MRITVYPCRDDDDLPTSIELELSGDPLPGQPYWHSLNWDIATRLFYALVARPTRLRLVVPHQTNGDATMPNFELFNTNVLHIPIQTTDTTGKLVPMPAGDVFAAASSDAGLGAAIGTDASGNPEFVVTPLVQLVDAATVTLSDSSGLTTASLVVDVIQPTALPAANDVLNVAGATLTTQAQPPT